MLAATLPKLFSTGHSNNEAALVYIMVSQFTMTNSEISGNTNLGSSPFQGEGGGVHLTGGELSGNSAANRGGGVYITGSMVSTFRITNGTVYGNDAGANNNNATNGVALYKDGGTMDYGSDWTSSWETIPMNTTGDTNARDATLTVVDGVLQ